jgi:hypothetical protein
MWICLLSLFACGSEGPLPSETRHPASHETAEGSSGWFVDATAESGLDFLHVTGMTEQRQLPETMGAGAALSDFDGDGKLDIYLVQSGSLPSPDRPLSAEPLFNALFLNNTEVTGRFSDHTLASGDAAHAGYGMGVAVGDVNNDGSSDLFVTNLGPDALLLNDGHAVFEDTTAETDLADERWTSSAAFFDADADGDLDLYVAAYVDIDLTNPPWCGRQEAGWRSYCHPDVFAGLPDRFYINDGAGRFTEATQQAGLSTRPGHHGKGLGVLAADFDDDGLQDLYVANDSVENRMWFNVGGGRFEDGTLISATGVNVRGLTEAGMGVATGDIDGDGDSDLFVTNFDDESNTLYRNDGDRLFSDVTARAGMDAESRLPVGFGTVLADLDADGDLDAAIANGHIIDNIALYHDGKTHAQHALLFTNDGNGRFADASNDAGAFTAQPVVGRGLYSGDLDGDGALDLVLTRSGEHALLLHNAGPPGMPEGQAAILAGLPRGARVEATRSDGSRLIRRAGPQPSYFGQTSSRVHLGLGQQALLALNIRLPGGQEWSYDFSPPWRPASPTESLTPFTWSGAGALKIPRRGEIMMNPTSSTGQPSDTPAGSNR